MADDQMDVVFQVIKMLVTVVVIFAFCWLPWQAFQLAFIISPEIVGR